MFRDIRLHAVMCLLVFGSHCCSQESVESTQFELIDALETAMTLGTSLSPYDVVGESTVSEEFGADDTSLAETVRFRLVFDQESEDLIWAYEQRMEAQFGGKEGSVNIGAAIIRGNEVAVYMVDSVGKRKFSSFESAVAESSIPLVRFWGLVPFPYWGDANREMQSLTNRIADKSSRATKREVSGGIKYTLRENHGPGQFDIREWQFDLPSHSVSARKVQRAAADSILVTYHEQEVFFDRIKGIRLPVVLDCKDMIIRRHEKGSEFGKKSTITELAWNRAREEVNEGLPLKVQFTGALDILKFIDGDEGKKQ